MFNKLRAWYNELRADLSVATYHAEPKVETLFDIFWINENAHEVTKRERVPASEVPVIVYGMLRSEHPEVGDTIFFRWHRGP